MSSEVTPHTHRPTHFFRNYFDVMRELLLVTMQAAVTLVQFTHTTKDCTMRPSDATCFCWPVTDAHTARLVLLTLVGESDWNSGRHLAARWNSVVTLSLKVFQRPFQSTSVASRATRCTGCFAYWKTRFDLRRSMNSWVVREANNGVDHRYQGRTRASSIHLAPEHISLRSKSVMPVESSSSTYSMAVIEMLYLFPSLELQIARWIKNNAFQIDTVVVHCVRCIKEWRMTSSYDVTIRSPTQVDLPCKFLNRAEAIISATTHNTTWFNAI